MTQYAALDVSQETTAICLVDDAGCVIGEAMLPTCPDAIAAWLARMASDLGRVGLETGPMAVWLWNELHARALPAVCLDARHAHAALKVRPIKTDRNDAAGLARIVRIGWFKQVQIKTRASYEVRSLLAGRDALAQTRVKLENEIRGLMRTFGVLCGKAVGGFKRRADELVAGELETSPAMRGLVEALLRARAAVLGEIKELDRQLAARDGQGASGRAPVHDRTGRRRHHRALGRLGVRPSAALPPLLERGRLPRPDPAPLPIGRGRPGRADLEAWQLADAQTPLRSSNRAADPHDQAIEPQSLGLATGPSCRVQEGARRRRPRARRHPACDVEEPSTLPLGRGGGMIGNTRPIPAA
jgi:transposase